MKRFLFAAVLSVMFGGALVLAAGPTFQIQRFADVSQDAWFFAPVHALRLYGIVSGYDGNVFRPGSFVKRSELAAMLVRTIEYIAHPSGKEPWQRFEHPQFRYAISYPSAWETVFVEDGAQGFRPTSMPQNFVQWAVLVFLNNDDALAQNIVDDMRSEYPNSVSVTRQDLTLNDLSIQHYIAVTPENPVWRREQVVFRHMNKTYVITNGGIENKDFDIFWRSFRFVSADESFNPDSSSAIDSLDGMPEWLKNASDVE